jgi:hypothetical protein
MRPPPYSPLNEFQAAWAAACWWAGASQPQIARDLGYGGDNPAPIVCTAIEMFLRTCGGR